MAKTTVSHELAAKYPEFNGRFGETVDTKEVQDVKRKHGDAPTVGEQVAARSKAPTAAAAAKKAPAKTAARSPRKTTAKKAKKR